MQSELSAAQSLVESFVVASALAAQGATSRSCVQPGWRGAFPEGRFVPWHLSREDGSSLLDDPFPSVQATLSGKREDLVERLMKNLGALH